MYILTIYNKISDYEGKYSIMFACQELISEVVAQGGENYMLRVDYRTFKVVPIGNKEIDRPCYCTLCDWRELLLPISYKM